MMLVLLVLGLFASVFSTACMPRWAIQVSTSCEQSPLCVSPQCAVNVTFQAHCSNSRSTTTPRLMKTTTDCVNWTSILEVNETTVRGWGRFPETQTQLCVTPFKYQCYSFCKINQFGTPTDGRCQKYDLLNGDVHMMGKCFFPIDFSAVQSAPCLSTLFAGAGSPLLCPSVSSSVVASLLVVFLSVVSVLF